MDAGPYLFGDFALDPADRRLTRDAQPVELNARYLDALTLLVREQGRLVTKERFLDEVWRGIPVTDEALTQCIRTLRRLLGDDAARPHFIETVPKHGYRFIAPVARDADPEPVRATPVRATPVRAATHAPEAVARPAWLRIVLLGGAGTLGGGIAGLAGGLFYGVAAASQLAGPGPGALSALLVIACATVAIALIGGAGVAFGIAIASIGSDTPWRWSMAGGAIGGLLIGATVKLLGLDAFELLFGHAPGDITGAAEGLALGAAVGAGGWLGRRFAGPDSLLRAVTIAALAGGLAGIVIAAFGGRLMAGSLALLSREMPGSRLSLDQVGALLDESGFGPISAAVTAGLEGLLFAGFVVGAMILAERGLARRA